MQNALVPQDITMTMNRDRRIGSLLLGAGLVRSGDIAEVEARAAATQTRFGSAAVELGLISEQEILQFLIQQHGVPAVDLTRCVLLRSVLDRIPREVAERDEVIPLRIEASNLLLGMTSPGDAKVIDEIAFVTGLSVLPYVAMQERLRSTLRDAYASRIDPYRGPWAEDVGADDEGFVAIVTDTPLPITADLGIEIEIDGESEQDSQGALFEVEDVVEERGPRAGYESWVSDLAKTVVVVDDEPEILELLVTAMRSLNVNVVSASGGLEALMKIKKFKPDLVVTDAMLPEVHGFEIVRKLKDSRRFRSTPVLMISAMYRGWRIAEEIRETYRVDAFVEKPFHVAELRHHVTRLLENARAEHSGGLQDEALSLYRQADGDYRAGKYEIALARLKDAESLEPFSSKIQFMLARVLERTQKPLQAIYHYERAVELSPTMFAATKNLAVLYQSKGFKAKAIEMWERSLKNAKNDETRAQIKSHLVAIQ